MLIFLIKLYGSSLDHKLFIESDILIIPIFLLIIGFIFFLRICIFLFILIVEKNIQKKTKKFQFLWQLLLLYKIKLKVNYQNT